MMQQKLTAGFGAKLPLIAAGLVLAGVLTAWSLRPVDTVSAAPAAGNHEYFLSLEGIEGDSTDSRHPDELLINSFSWGKGEPGVKQTGSPAGGSGGGAGKAVASDIVFTQAAGKASPLLMKASAEGRHIPEAKLTVRRNGENQVEPLVIKLKDVIISSYSVGGQDGGQPADEFSLRFAEIEYSYSTQRANGTSEQPITTNWNFKTNN